MVEAQGHLIDSHIMERIFDSVVEFGGRFEVEHFRIGRTNSDPSSLRLRVEASSEEQMDRLMTPVARSRLHRADSGDAELQTRRARSLRAGRFLFHHQPANARAPPRPLAGSRGTSAWTP